MRVIAVSRVKSRWSRRGLCWSDRVRTLYMLGFHTNLFQAMNQTVRSNNMVAPDDHEISSICRKKTGNPVRPLFVPFGLIRLIHGWTFLAHPIEGVRILVTSDPPVVLVVAPGLLIVDEVEQVLHILALDIVRLGCEPASHIHAGCKF